VWDTTTGQQLVEFDRGRAAAKSLAFSPDATELNLVSEDKSVKRWNWREAKEIPLANAPRVADRHGIHGAVYLPLGSLCVFGGMGRDANKAFGELSVADLRNGTKLWETKLGDVWPWELAISADGKVLATYLQTRTKSKSVSRLAIWSMRDGKELSSFDLPDNAVRSLAFSPDGTRLVSGMELGDALVWNVAAASEKHK
jgi:WD40 repeat protein